MTWGSYTPGGEGLGPKVPVTGYTQNYSAEWSVSPDARPVDDRYYSPQLVDDGYMSGSVYGFGIGYKYIQPGAEAAGQITQESNSCPESVKDPVSAAGHVACTNP